MDDRDFKTIGQYFSLKAVGIFAVGIILGIVFAVPLAERGLVSTDLVASLLSGGDEELFSDEEQKSAAPEFDSQQQKIVSENNMLVVANQSAGGSVVMSMVSLDESGWVAIHEGLSDGAFGNILGARRFGAGREFGAVIELLRETADGNVYYAVLHGDDGDSSFDFKKEAPVSDVHGAAVTARFVVTPSE